MTTLDPFELEISADYESGEFVSISPNTKPMNRFKAAAIATFIASEVHQYVSDRMVEKEAQVFSVSFNASTIALT